MVRRGRKPTQTLVTTLPGNKSLGSFKSVLFYSLGRRRSEKWVK